MDGPTPLLPEEVFREVVEEIAPPLPSPDTDGNYPAIEAGRAIVAWGILRDRLLAGLSRTELAKRSKVRLDRLARIERGEIDPTTAEVDRLDADAPSPP